MPTFKLRRAREFRAKPTPAEAKVWAMVRNRQLLGYKFRRQVVLYGFIADFYCAKLRLVIEVDGPIHDCRKEYDAYRTGVLESKGLSVLRIRNEDVSPRNVELLLRDWLARS